MQNTFVRSAPHNHFSLIQSLSVKRSSASNNHHQSIIVKIYELKVSAIFKYADYVTLNEFAKEVLEPDFISEQEVKLTPNNEKILTITPSPQTKYIAVMASYKNNQNTVWRQVIPIYPFENKHQGFIFSKIGITLIDEVLISKKNRKASTIKSFRLVSVVHVNKHRVRDFLHKCERLSIDPHDQSI